MASLEKTTPVRRKGTRTTIRFIKAVMFRD
jgi:hypothetical protein